jgi:hypothetical protein
VQIDPVEHVGAIAVAEAHRSQADVAPYWCGEGRGTWGHGGLYGQQVEDSPGRGHATLIQVEGLTQVGEGPQQALGHEDQDRVDADLEATVEHQAPADEKRGGEPGEDGHADEGDEGRGVPNGLAVG